MCQLWGRLLWIFFFYYWVTVVICNKLLLTLFWLLRSPTESAWESWQNWHSSLVEWRNSQIQVNKSLLQITSVTHYVVITLQENFRMFIKFCCTAVRSKDEALETFYFSKIDLTMHLMHPHDTISRTKRCGKVLWPQNQSFILKTCVFSLLLGHLRNIE